MYKTILSKYPKVQTWRRAFSICPLVDLESPKYSVSEVFVILISYGHDRMVFEMIEVLQIARNLLCCCHQTPTNNNECGSLQETTRKSGHIVQKFAYALAGPVGGGTALAIDEGADEDELLGGERSRPAAFNAAPSLSVVVITFAASAFSKYGKCSPLELTLEFPMMVTGRLPSVYLLVIARMTAAWSATDDIGTKLSPGLSMRFGMVATPMGLLSTKTFWEMVPSSMVMGEGLGMKTWPLMLVPSFSGTSVIVILRTSKPLRPLRPSQ
jgi:hypothetical protein